MKRWAVVVGIVVVVAGIATGAVVYFVRSTSAWADTLEWNEPDLVNVPDGEYIGSASVKLPAGTAAANTTTTVRVVVSDHRYVSIEIVHPPTATASMADFAQTVIETQTIKPDDISGATVSKSLLLMAVADALSGI